MTETFIQYENRAILTDLYEITMLHAYRRGGMDGMAVFDLFVRRLPENRNYLVAAGLDSALGFLENLAFSDEDVVYLSGLPPFRGQNLDYLKSIRFTGSVRAVPEGTPVFPNEPILEVEAPIGEAQIVESYLLNQITFQTIAASKAARVVHAAGDAAVVDFGLRRMHGTDAGVKGARAFYIAGVAATSNLLAGRDYGIPVRGTMAHSYIQAHDDEDEAFRSFARIYPETVLLVDTYDTIEGVRGVIDLARRLGSDFRVQAIRLDSGNLGELARESRRLLDEAGLHNVGIFASSSLDEYEIARLRDAGAPINGYGVGTAMGVSSDAPSLDTVYKLVEYDGRGRIKLSSEKSTLPGKKQVFRSFENGIAAGDTVACLNETHEGIPLLQTVMRDGKRIDDGRVSLEVSRQYAEKQRASLPKAVLNLAPADPAYPVGFSGELRRKRDEIADRLKKRRS